MRTALNFNKIHRLPADTDCYQVDDGTIFYFKHSLPQRLYVRARSGIIDADLSIGTVLRVAAHGSSLYFSTTKRAIYKARFFDYLESIDVTCMRDLMEGEQEDMLSSSGLLYAVTDGKKYVYRMCDDPRDERALVTPTVEQEGGRLVGVWVTANKSMAVFAREDPELGQPSLKLMSQSAVGLTMPHFDANATFLAPNSSPHLYVAHEQDLFVFHTDKPETQCVYFPGIKDLKIVGARDEVVTVTGEEDGSRYVLYAKTFLKMAGQLWQFTSDNETEMTARKQVQMEQKLKEDAVKKEEDWTDCDAWRRLHSAQKRKEEAKKPRSAWNNGSPKEQSWEDVMGETINGLLDKNSELADELQHLQLQSLQNFGSSEREEPPVEDRDAEQERINTLLEEENAEIFLNLERTSTLNEELEAANDQLTEERDELYRDGEEMEEELDSEIGGLRAQLSKLKNGMSSMEEEETTSAEEVEKENKELRSLIEKMLKENEELCNELGGSKGVRIKEILRANEEMMQQVRSSLF